MRIKKRKSVGEKKRRRRESWAADMGTMIPVIHYTTVTKYSIQCQSIITGNIIYYLARAFGS